MCSSRRALWKQICLSSYWVALLWYLFRPKVNLRRTESGEYVSKWSLLQSGNTLPSCLEPRALHQSPRVNLMGKFHKSFPPGVFRRDAVHQSPRVNLMSRFHQSFPPGVRFEGNLGEHLSKHIPQITLLRIMCSRQRSETLSFLHGPLELPCVFSHFLRNVDTCVVMCQDVRGHRIMSLIAFR